MVLNNKIVEWTYYEYSIDKLVDAAEVHSLYILRDYQNKGYGKNYYKFFQLKLI